MAEIGLASPAHGDSPLDLSALRSAVQALTDALAIVSGPDFAGVDPRWRDLLVAGVVQHFEFTFECEKTQQVAAGALALLQQCRGSLIRLEECNSG